MYEVHGIESEFASHEESDEKQLVFVGAVDVETGTKYTHNLETCFS